MELWLQFIKTMIFSAPSRWPADRRTAGVGWRGLLQVSGRPRALLSHWCGRRRRQGSGQWWWPSQLSSGLLPLLLPRLLGLQKGLMLLPACQALLHTHTHTRTYAHTHGPLSWSSLCHVQLRDDLMLMWSADEFVHRCCVLLEALPNSHYGTLVCFYC